jgi:hypothetical protein
MFLGAEKSHFLPKSPIKSCLHHVVTPTVQKVFLSVAPNTLKEYVNHAHFNEDLFSTKFFETYPLLPAFCNKILADQ